MHNRIALFTVPALWMLLAFPSAFAAQSDTDSTTGLYPHADQILVGRIYSNRSDGEQRLLYNFRRTAKRDGSTLNVRRTYTYPDGRIAAVEKATYRDGDLASYTLQQKQIDAHGQLAIKGDAYAGTGSVQFTYTSDDDTETATETLSGPTVINETIVAYMQEHWSELMSGKTLDIRYLVIPRLETVGFSLGKSGEDNWNGNEVVNIKMDPSSFFIGLVVDPVYFTFDKSSREIIQYTGRTTPKIKKDGEWQPLDAVSTFHWVSNQSG